ncbi:MAG: hypothetical protein GY853_15990 [PVC group bacterium]|nr:hypothetical protein [PVC group bacterium]
MATKKRINQLETLLNWEKEVDRLPQTTELFNRLISPSLILREVGLRQWAIEIFETTGNNRTSRTMLICHETLVQLGLTILDAAKTTEDRYVNSQE